MHTRFAINRMLATARKQARDMVRRLCTHVDFQLPTSRQQEWDAQLEQFPVREAFATWLETNRARFRHPPVRVPSSVSHHDAYAFQGINPNLYLQLSDCRVECMCRIPLADSEDIITDFDIDARRLPTGEWVCIQCDEKKRLPYADAVTLCAAHSFQPLLDWCNTHFSRENALALFVGYDLAEGLLRSSCCAAELLPRETAWTRFQGGGEYVAVEQVVMVDPEDAHAASS